MFYTFGYNTKKYKMNKSPFVFGKTVSGQAFTNRIEDKKRLLGNLTNGINTIIISPRRWGKSSLVENVFEEINQQNKNIKTLHIDLFSVADENEFLEKLAREIIKASSNKWEEWIDNAKNFFKMLIPTISLGSDPMQDFSLSFNIKDLPKHSDEILNLAEVIAQKKDIKFVIGLDEFQNIGQYSNYPEFEKKLRSVWQRQKKVTYCLYGSKRHMMTDIFNNPSKAFYRFGELILLQKIATKEWIKYIIDNFKKTGKVITKSQAEKISILMDNHPWYVQQLAHYVWMKTPKNTTDTIIEEALNEIIDVNKPFFQFQIEQLSNTQINLLKAVAHGETKLTSGAVMQKYKLGTPRNVSKNKNSLIQKDIIDIQSNKKIIFLDPVFQLWFEQDYLTS